MINLEVLLKMKEKVAEEITFATAKMSVISELIKAEEEATEQVELCEQEENI